VACQHLSDGLYQKLSVIRFSPQRRRGRKEKTFASLCPLRLCGKFFCHFFISDKVCCNTVLKTVRAAECGSPVFTRQFNLDKAVA
jgi:hypothetical protein